MHLFIYRSILSSHRSIYFSVDPSFYLSMLSYIHTCGERYLHNRILVCVCTRAPFVGERDPPQVDAAPSGR